MNYQFKKASINELDDAFFIILDRINWMTLNGIYQWNVTNYLGRYPYEYYQNEILNQHLFILKDENNVVVSLAVLKDIDDRWHDNKKALYVRNLASLPQVKGVGKKMMEQIITYAKNNHYEYVRLDSAVDNKKLEAFYNSFNFNEKGTCQAGKYFGILREKKL